MIYPTMLTKTMLKQAKRAVTVWMLQLVITNDLGANILTNGKILEGTLAMTIRPTYGVKVSLYKRYCNYCDSIGLLYYSSISKLQDVFVLEDDLDQFFR